MYQTYGERMSLFLQSFEQPQKNPILKQIEEQAHKNGVPIIRKEMESFLQVMIQITKANRILELGTATGYSALVMSEAQEVGGTITTIENYAPRIEEAKENIRQAKKENQIQLLEGDALEVMSSLEGPYDLIFMDAAKGQYLRYLPEALRLLEDDGVLISDNVLKGGEIVESRFQVERRNRTIHSRMREYLYELKHRKDITTTILPLGDGVSLTVKMNKKKGE